MTKQTFKSRACTEVPEFKEICNTLIRKFLVAGKSISCAEDYLLQISKLVLFYKRSPLALSTEEIEEYMAYYLKNHSPSLSSFKHFICGLRHIFNIHNRPDLNVILPCVRQSQRLPVVLSKKEIKLLLKTPESLKQRVILATIYDAGLRISEAINLFISDVDLDRKMIHIRQSKFKKDRYVPISNILIRGLKQYIEIFKPEVYLFNSLQKGLPMTQSSIQRIMRKTLKKCNIRKKASVHTLRHSYATHLLEDGLDIVSVKNQLGHVDIKNTMTYLHVARVNPKLGFSPLKYLYHSEFIV
ncbi:MAG TPA: integrase [Bacteroidales bacterium]|jgi:site-specific recombinase XerD|nr:integrase [Bacteroidales bacterium]